MARFGGTCSFFLVNPLRSKRASFVIKTRGEFIWVCFKIWEQTGQKTLSEKIDAMNSELQKFSPWPVTVGYDLSFAYGGRDVSLCCESERWRVSLIVQIFIANTVGDRAIIIDRGDILDNKNKNMLFKMLSRQPFFSLVLIKANNSSETILLPEKIGKSYWVEKGVCSIIS